MIECMQQIKVRKPDCCIGGKELHYNQTAELGHENLINYWQHHLDFQPIKFTDHVYWYFTTLFNWEIVEFLIVIGWVFYKSKKAVVSII